MSKIMDAEATLLKVLKEGIINDHNGDIDKDIVALVTLKGGHVCPIYPAPYQSLNPLYEGSDGKIHLSEWSTGGCLRGFEFDIYNETQLIDRAKISQIIVAPGYDLGNKYTAVAI